VMTMTLAPITQASLRLRASAFCFGDGSVRTLRSEAAAHAPLSTIANWKTDNPGLYAVQLLAGYKDGLRVDLAELE
jgi:hypothetical protein